MGRSSGMGSAETSTRPQAAFCASTLRTRKMRRPAPTANPTRNERRAASTKTLIMEPPSCGWIGILRSGDAVGQALEFGAVEHLGIDHADQQRFHRTLAKPIRDALDCTARDALARLGRAVDEGAIVD